MSEWTADSNEALKIHLVRARDDEAVLSPTEKPLTKVFHPKFTYPIFGEEEKIYGYEDLSINLFLSSGSLRQFVTVEYSERLTGKAIDDPENTLYQYLSDDRLKSLEGFAKEVDKDATEFKPIGEKIHSYVRKRGRGKPGNKDPREIAIGQSKKTDDDRPRKIEEENEDAVVYEVYHVNFRNPGFLQFHRRMQIFILLYIEAGSYIEEEDDKWEFVTLFEKRKRKDGKEVYHFVGYSSLYPFYFYPESTRLRLSQFVIIGPYQKQGHGAALYKAIHDFVLQSPRFAELTVEDPSEDFEDLRDKVDMRTLLAHQEFVREAYGAIGPNGTLAVSRRGTAKRPGAGKENAEGHKAAGKEASKTRASEVAMLGPPTKPKWAERWRIELKFAKRQYERLIEMLILRALDENDEAAQRAFRLQVKARLKTFNFETLMQLEQEEQFDKLEETFQSVKEGYERLLGMLK